MRRAGSVVKKSLGTSPSATTTDDAQEAEHQKPRPPPPPPPPPAPTTTTAAVPAMSSEPDIGSSGELGIDFPILPSTSSFTLPGKEDKGEKLKKKARNFLDERQKIKSRAQSLWSYIDAANSFDQARFFQENAEQVFHVVYETCMHHIEKMKQKNERPQSWNSKDLVTLQKNLLLLRKIFLYLPELMRNGWQRKNIAKLLAHILDHGNHLRLRALGFHLLLLWLNDQVVEYPECMELFANAIALDLFVLDEIKPSVNASTKTNAETSASEDKVASSTTTSKHHGSGLNFVKKLSERHTERTFGHGLSRDEKIKNSKLRLHQKLILGDDQAPLYPNPVQPTFNDSIVLLHIFTTNLVRLAYVAAGSPPPRDEYEYPPGDNVEADDGIATGVGIDAATASAKFMFRIFRTYYMSKFTPQIAKALKMDGVPSSDEDFGFPACPPCILRTLLRFLIGYCLDNSEKLNVGQWLPSATGTPSPATPILKSIVLSSYETREMLHELLRQAMTLPCTNPEYRDITRGAMHILGVWMLGSEDERPSFLRRTGSWSLIASNTQGSITRSSSHSSALTSAADEDDYKSADANMFLRRYFLMIKLVFDQHVIIDPDDLHVVDWDGLVSLYKDALNVYRAVTVSRGGIDIEVESWELLLHCLMDIQDRFLNQGQKYTRIPNSQLADDFAEYLSDTILHAFVRAKIAHTEIWKDLKNYLLASTRWMESLQSWVKIMHKLTRLLSARLYNVEYDAYPSDRPDEHHRYSLHISSNSYRSRSKVRSRHLSIQGDLRSGNRRSAGRPLSSGASDGQLMDSQQQLPTPPLPLPTSDHFSDGGIVRNVSNISLSEKGSKTSDRRSIVLQDVEDTEEAKAGVKSVAPASTSSTSYTQTQQPVVTGNGSQRRANTSRRTVSIHQLDTLFQESGSKLLSFVHHHGDTVEPTASMSKSLVTARDEEDKRKQAEWDQRSMGSSIDRMPLEESVNQSIKSNRTSVSLVLPTGEAISLTTSTAAVNEKLPASLGMFKSSEFLNLDNITADGSSVLAIWKNMLCALGNINELQRPQDHAVVVSCVVDIWDTLEWVRAHQPYHVEYMPALYEMAPWFLQAAELPTTYDAGRAIAYGCLCRLFCHRSEETVPETYYAYFYRALLKGLSSSDTAIIESIIRNSDRLFSASLPSAYILIPSFFDAIERQLLDGDTPREVSTSVRRSCITILGTFVSISNHFKNVRIDLQKPMTSLNETEFAFSDIKVWLKDLLLRLVNGGTPMDKIEQDPDVRCMLLGVICSLALDELLVNSRPQQTLVQDSVLAMVNHLYWSNINIVNTAVDCLNTLAQVYKEELDSDGIIVEEVLTRIIDALNVHLKYYERHSKDGRGFIISKLFSCLLEWLMVIDPMILSETELCQLVFDVIEYALHITSEGGSEKLLPHPPDLRSENRRKKEVPFKFKLLTEKRPPIHQEYANVVAPGVSESDQGYVKESAEATLLHLLHHFNNFAPPSGPATIHSTITGPGVAQEENEEHMGYQYFSYNESTIIAFVELPPRSNSENSIARIIVRDITGRYVWDSRLEPKTLQSSQQPTKIEESLEKEYGYALREGLQVRTPDEIHEAMKRDPNSNTDRLQELLKGISSSNVDCQETAQTPLPLTQHQAGMVGRLDEQLNEFLQDESNSNSQQEFNTNLWFSKVNVLRRNPTTTAAGSFYQHLTANFALKKDFSPAFPHETEKSQVPFQQSRLLLSHLGFINYDQLKDGSFQMLNKTPSLYRDLRGLDRKHGRETMKIAVIYVGPGQEDEQSILHNSRGSPQYDAFVNSLGWEIDIATHTGYLGGLERNLTNGTRANYYCNSTLEMIFHDVTKMPTEADDPKQLKKKRHVGNDHVHIVWNEHDRDYQIGTIGGDFGNAQIVVSPLPNGLYAIRVYRDAKVPYFGPLFDGMVVSQAILGPLVRATAINAFRRSVHNNYYSFYKCVYAQRANDIKTITNRHKVATWSYEHFMEKIFMPSAE